MKKYYRNQFYILTTMVQSAKMLKNIILEAMGDGIYNEGWRAYKKSYVLRQKMVKQRCYLH